MLDMDVRTALGRGGGAREGSSLPRLGGVKAESGGVQCGREGSGVFRVVGERAEGEKPLPCPVGSLGKEARMRSPWPPGQPVGERCSWMTVGGCRLRVGEIEGFPCLWEPWAERRRMALLAASAALAGLGLGGGCRELQSPSARTAVSPSPSALLGSAALTTRRHLPFPLAKSVHLC